MTSQEHGHVPAVVILVKSLLAWREAHNGQGPAHPAERKEFIAELMKQKRNQDEENFDEAVAYFRRAGTKQGVSVEVSC